MKFNDIEELEKSLTREELDEFERYLVDVTQDLTAHRGYDSQFIYSKFCDMNTRTAIYLGYVMGMKRMRK